MVASCLAPGELQPFHKKYFMLISIRDLPLFIPFGRGVCCVIGSNHLAGLHGDLVEVSEVLTHDLGHPGRSGKTVMEVSAGRPSWHALPSFLNRWGFFWTRSGLKCSRATMVSNLSAMRVANYPPSWRY